jgi:hypothetical protein
MGFDFMREGVTGDGIEAGVPVAGAERRSELDFEYARAMLAEFESRIVEMEREAAAFVVTDEETAREATDRAGAVLSFVKAFEDRRKEIIRDADSFVRKTNQVCKSKRDRLDAIARRYKDSLADYKYQEELKRREIVRKQEEERAKLQAALDAEATRLKVDPVTVAPVAVPRTAGPVRAESATSSTVMVWDFEVVDPGAVPRNYLAVDPAAIRAAIKGGIREIDGVRIFERAEIRVRRVG